jgi:hypothetical protein
MSVENHADTASTLMIKAAPPASVTLASLAGMPVSDLVLWATLVYTVLMIGHKVYQIWQDVKKMLEK